MFRLNWLLCVVLSASAVTCILAQECKFNIRTDLDSKSPIILNENGDIVLPDAATGNIELKSSAQVTFVCSGDINQFAEPSHPKQVKQIKGTCDSGTTFNVGQKLDIKNIKCSRTPESVPKILKTKCNGRKYTSAKIGFQVSDSEFIDVIELCFEEETSRPSYTKHLLQPAANIRQVQTYYAFRNVDTFLFSNLGNRPGNLYPCKAQWEMLTKILGSEEQAAKFETCSVSKRGGANQFVRGHLSPNADFVYSFLQNATYYHANTAPQWQFFNNRNWKSVEERVRAHAGTVGYPLQLYTGTSEEVTFLPDENNNNEKIFLSADDKKLPAPLYYWKVVHDQRSSSAIAFIGYNIHYDVPFEIPNQKCICVDKLWFKKSEITPEKGLICCLALGDFLKYTGFKDFKGKVSDTIVYKVRSERYVEIDAETQETASSSAVELWAIGMKIIFVSVLIMY